MNLVTPDITQKARELMKIRFKENQAPAWGLIEIAAEATERLAKIYNIDVNLALTTSYLCHIIFSKERGTEIMKNHTNLSADEAEQKLTEWGAEVSIIPRISHAIRNHHSSEIDSDKLVEIVKQADTYKFLTTKGLLLFIVSLNERGISLKEAIEYSRYKVKQKYSYVNLPEVKDDIYQEIDFIKNILDIDL